MTTYSTHSMPHASLCIPVTNAQKKRTLAATSGRSASAVELKAETAVPSVGTAIVSASGTAAGCSRAGAIPVALGEIATLAASASAAAGLLTDGRVIGVALTLVVAWCFKVIRPKKSAAHV